MIGYIIGLFINWALDLKNFVTVTIPDVINKTIEWFKKLPERISEFIKNLVDWFRQLPGKIWEALTNAYNNIVTWISNTKNKMVQGVKDIVNNTIEWFKQLPDNMKNIGKNIVEGIWQGIQNARDWMYQKVSEFAKGILDGIKNSLGIHSPSTKARDLAKFVPQGFAVGIKADTSKALDAIDQMNDSIVDKMSNAVNVETGKSSFSGLNGSVSEILNSNSVIQVENYNTLELDGEKVYENQQTIKKNKNLQYAFGG